MAAAKRNNTNDGYGEKQQVRVITVDKEKSRIECAMRDGAMVYAAVWETPTVFRWPNVGEIWTIRKDSGIWRLDQQVQSELGEVEADSTPVTLNNLPEGDTRILGKTVHVNKLIAKEGSSGVGGVEVVFHGADDSVARPAVKTVIWIGSVTPLNMDLENDIRLNDEP